MDILYSNVLVHVLLLQISDSQPATSSTHDDKNETIGIAVGVSVALLVIIGRELSIS